MARFNYLPELFVLNLFGRMAGNDLNGAPKVALSLCCQIGNLLNGIFPGRCNYNMNKIFLTYMFCNYNLLKVFFFS